MRIIEPSVELIGELDAEQIMKHIELAGRVCYKSESRIADKSAEKFIANIIKSGHESVIEHVSLTFKIICDRGVTHEIVRHRLASYSQSSTRYCNYASDKFGNELTFIKPCFWSEDDENYKLWADTMSVVEKNYLAMINGGAQPQQARSILPNSLMTEIFMTANLREWRTILKLRCSNRAHPQMREIMMKVLSILYKNLPIVFEDIWEMYGNECL